MNKSANSFEQPIQRLTLRVVAGAVLVMFLWSICFPMISIGLDYSPPLIFAALRAALSGLILLLIAQIQRRPAVRGAFVWRGIVVVGLTATTIGFFGMFLGGGRVSPGLATVVANIQPLVAAVIAWLFLDEQLTSIQRWGLLLGFAGIVVIGLSMKTGSETQLFGLLLILIAAVGIAISNVLMKRIAGHVDILRAMGWQLAIGSVPLALLSILFEDIHTIDWSLPFVLNLIVLSVAGTSAAFALWFFLLQRAKLSQLNVFTFLTPIFGLAMGAMFFAEQLHAVAIIGIGLSLVGIYAVSRPSRTTVVASPGHSQGAQSK
jgi:drug/metabolite transporter (DMT)-like permease